MSDVAAAPAWGRPEIRIDDVPQADLADIRLPLSGWERLWKHAWLRQGVIVVALLAIWEVYGRLLDEPLMFPAVSEVLQALFDDILNGVLPARTLATLQTLLLAYALGVGLAAILTTLAVSTRFGTDLLSTLTAMFNPLPAIALLPLALLWFGLGRGSLIFVIIHSVLWAVALNTHSGFLSVSDTLRMAGRNVGLRGIGLVTSILIPAAFPAILSGLKVGWAFAWRTIIAAELVFGVSSRSGGLGWYIFENQNRLNTSNVFAGLLTVILIGLLVEGVVFRLIERRTVRRWGMQGG